MMEEWGRLIRIALSWKEKSEKQTKVRNREVKKRNEKKETENFRKEKEKKANIGDFRTFKHFFIQFQDLFNTNYQ